MSTMSLVCEGITPDVDPLIRRAEIMAVGDNLASEWQPLAEFALGLVMGSRDMEIDAGADHPEPFSIGARCGQILISRMHQDSLSSQVQTYLDERLEAVRTYKGKDWQWSDAFPAA